MHIMEVASLSLSFNAGEHNYRIINVTLDAHLANKTVRLAFVTPKGRHILSDALEVDGTKATYSLPSSVLDGNGTLCVQAIVYDGKEFVAKSTVKRFRVEKALDEWELSDSENTVSPEYLADQTNKALTEIDGTKTRLTALENAYDDMQSYVSAIEGISFVTNLKGKKWVSLGDDETAENPWKTKNYIEIVSERFGCSQYVNHAEDNAYFAVEYPGDSNGFFYKWQNLDDDAEVIIVQGGTLDYLNGFAEMGIPDDMNVSCFRGAVANLCNALLKKYPDKTIVFVTPVHIDDDIYKNVRGLTLADYVEAIKTVCGLYSIPVYDAYSLSGICPRVDAQREWYAPEVFFLNDFGHERVADGLEKFIYSLSSVKVQMEVRKASAPTELLLDNDTLTLFGGETGNVRSYVLPVDAVDKGVEWSSEDRELSINGDGDRCTVSAPPGEYTLKGSVNNGELSKTCKIKVKKPPSSLASISIKASYDTVRIGTKETLNAVLSPSTSDERPIEWTTDSDCVMLIPDGRACGVIGVSQGEARITCRDVLSGMEGDCVIKSRFTVPVEKLTVSPAALAVRPRQFNLLRAVVYPENASNQEVSWTVSDSTIADIDTNGDSCLVRSLSTGLCNVSCIGDNGKKTVVVPIKVVDEIVNVTGVGLDKTRMTIDVGETTMLLASIQPINASNDYVIWSSSNDNVMVVTTYGKSCVLRGIKSGTSTVTVKTAEGAYKAYCTVTVR